jgi:hypothetical protein
MRKLMHDMHLDVVVAILEMVFSRRVEMELYGLIFQLLSIVVQCQLAQVGPQLLIARNRVR